MVETVTPAPAAAPVAAPAASLGQSIDNEIAALKARVVTLEGNVKTFWTKQWNWLKANWPHLVTWGLSAVSVVKSGVLSSILKL